MWRKLMVGIRIFVHALVIVFALYETHEAQVASGGTYTLEQTVIANGGGKSMSGNYTVEGTTAQAVAGTVSGASTYGVNGGFWQAFFAPTAAMVSISGRVFDAQGMPIGQVRMILNDGSGTILTVITNNFGYYRIDGVEVGQTYILTPTNRRYRFAARVVTVMDEIVELDIVAQQ